MLKVSLLALKSLALAILTFEKFPYSQIKPIDRTGKVIYNQNLLVASDQSVDRSTLTTGGYFVQVIDLNGRVIFTKMDANGNENIILDGIRKGVYIVTITSGEHVFHYRMVKAN
jgi:hypothetical protein